MMKLVSLLMTFWISIYISVEHDDMVYIPAGKFIMGSDFKDANEDQKPAHAVYLDAYYIDRFEVTNQQYEEFILAGGYQRKEFWTEEGWEFMKRNNIKHPMGWGNPLFDEPDQPVVGVSWYEAMAYAKWRGKRLPTEAEWEKAARGTDGRIYPWGNGMDFSKLMYFPGNGITTLIIGSFKGGASPYGVMDMAGNVWEWCLDRYDKYYYSKSPVRNPKGPNEGDYHVLRGGAWDSIRIQLRCIYRYYAKPDKRAYNIGFRCVRDAQEKSGEDSRSDSPSDKPPQIVVEDEVCDFGEMVGGSEIEHTFKVKNIGSKTVKIENVTHPCSCIMLSSIKSEIPPEGCLSIKAKLKVPTENKKVERDIYLYTNIPEQRVIKLCFRGTAFMPISTFPKRIFFGGFIQGDSPKKLLTIHRSERKKVHIIGVRTNLRYWFFVKFCDKKQVIQPCQG